MEELIRLLLSDIIISEHLITTVAVEHCGVGGFLQDLARWYWTPYWRPTEYSA